MSCSPARNQGRWSHEGRLGDIRQTGGGDLSCLARAMVGGGWSQAGGLHGVCGEDCGAHMPELAYGMRGHCRTGEEPPIDFEPEEVRAG